MSKKEFDKYNSIPSASICATFADMLNSAAPLGVEPPVESVISDMVKSGFNRSEKLLVFHPSFLGESVLKSFPKEEIALSTACKSYLPLLSSYPPSPFFNLLSFYSGQILSDKKDKDKEYNFLFQKEKVLIIGEKCEFLEIAQQRKFATVHLCSSEHEIIPYAVKAIKENSADVIIILSNEFASSVKLSDTKSKKTALALDYTVKSFFLLKDAIEVYWDKYNVSYAFLPTCGCHNTFFGGRCGKMCPEDMNIPLYMGYKKSSLL